MSEPFLAMITMFGGNFAPRGWAFCDGQILPITSNEALFSLLGTTYGGDGRTTFGLPELRGRVPIYDGSGTGPGLSSYSLGQGGGAETVTLIANNLPSHNHSFNVQGSADPGTDATPGAGLLPAETSEDNYASSNPVTMQAGTTANNGSNQAFSIIQPFRTVNYIIALEGTFPSRN